MDDLLIVRMSDRSKERFARRPMNAPMGANLGLLMGVGLAVCFSSAVPHHPFLGMTIGMALGLALGGLFGRFIRQPLQRKRPPLVHHYDGLPFEPDAEEKKPDDDQPEAKENAA